MSKMRAGFRPVVAPPDRARYADRGNIGTGFALSASQRQGPMLFLHYRPIAFGCTSRTGATTASAERDAK